MTEIWKHELKELKENIEKMFIEYPDRLNRSDFFDGNELKTNDLISDEITNIFDTRSIGEEYRYEKLYKIYEEGERRYSLKIPPGYKDAETKKDYRKFGDLIIWYQMIDKALDEKLPIIFITEDVKEDWWEKENEWKRPHSELLFEFFSKTEQYFMMYTYTDFVKTAKVFIPDLPNTETAVEEFDIIIEDENRKFNMSHLIKNGELYLAHTENDVLLVLIFTQDCDMNNVHNISVIPISTEEAENKSLIQFIYNGYIHTVQFERVLAIKIDLLSDYIGRLHSDTMNRLNGEIIKKLSRGF